MTPRVEAEVDDAEVEGAEEATSNQEGVIVPLSLGPRESGHIRVLGLTANTTLETLRGEVGRALGLRRHMFVLIDTSKRTQPPLDRKMSEFSPPGSTGATVRIPAGDPESKGVPIQIFGAHSSRIPILLPPNVEPQYLPTFLCEEHWYGNVYCVECATHPRIGHNVVLLTHDKCS